MNAKSRTEPKYDFENYFFKLMNNSVFGKTIENVKMQGGNKLATRDKRRNQLVSKANYLLATLNSQYI